MPHANKDTLDNQTPNSWHDVIQKGARTPWFSSPCEPYRRERAHQTFASHTRRESSIKQQTHRIERGVAGAQSFFNPYRA